MEKGAPPPYTANPPPPGIYVPPPTHMQPTYGGPPPPQATTVIVTGNPTIVATLGPASQRLTCPYCHQQISTSVTSEPSTKTHLFALLLFLFGCWPCCCVPYCMDSCQNQNHYCPSCNAFLGAYSE